MVWRRATGALLMVLGVGVIVVMIAFTILALVPQFRAADVWARLADTIAIQAAITGPGILAGILLLVVGRWVYGKWETAAPIANTTSYLLSTAGVVVTFALGAMLAFLLFTGFKLPDDAAAAVLLSLGACAGIVIWVLGLRIKGSGRSYLD